MSKIMVYDTETTGLPMYGERSDDPRQPRITQIAAQVVDDQSGNVHAGMNCIMLPDGWTIPDELQALTGITMEHARSVGVPVGEALNIFLRYWQMCDFRVAHNESFDARMIRIELVRRNRLTHDEYTSAEFADKWADGSAFCTARESTAIINLPPSQKMAAKGMTFPKTPNLSEAYQHFAGKPLESAHNAAVDLEACKVVYFGILKHRAGTKKETTA